MQPFLATLGTITALLLLAAPALAADFNRFPAQTTRAAQAEADAAQIAELKELLRQAQELQKAQQKMQAENAKPGAETVPAKAAGTEAEEKAKDGEKADGEKEEPEKKTARPGCMYRGHTLIWEKVPGTCR